MSLIYLATFLFSLTMGALIMPRIVSISQKKNLMDAPDDRKVHPIPVPRLGGISFLPLTMMSIFLFNILCMTLLGAEVKAGDTNTFLRIQCCGMGAMLLFLVGVADDLVGVDYRVKFLAQTAAAALFPLSGLTFGSLFTGSLDGALGIISLIVSVAALACGVYMLFFKKYKEATTLTSDVKIK